MRTFDTSSLPEQPARLMAKQSSAHETPKEQSVAPKKLLKSGKTASEASLARERARQRAGSDD
jgi:hypothetical protein